MNKLMVYFRYDLMKKVVINTNKYTFYKSRFHSGNPFDAGGHRPTNSWL